MGYILRPSSSYLQIYSGVSWALLTNGATNHNMANLVVPEFNGTITRATVDFIFLSAEDTSVAQNYFDGATTVDLEDTGSTWRNACNVADQLILIPASTNLTAYFRVGGTIDVKSYIKSDTTYQMRWANVKSLGNNLKVKGIQSVLNIYFE